jgi:hypothetical protein
MSSAGWEDPWAGGRPGVPWSSAPSTGSAANAPINRSPSSTPANGSPSTTPANGSPSGSPIAGPACDAPLAPPPPPLPTDAPIPASPVSGAQWPPAVLAEPSSTAGAAHAAWDSVPSGIRVDDAQREEASAELRQHFTEGRLDVDEFSRRLDEVWQATDTGDLDRALRQLPRTAGRARSWDRRPDPGPSLPPGPPGPPYGMTAAGGWPGRSGPVQQFRQSGLPTWAKVLIAIAVVFVLANLWPVWLIALGVWFFIIRPRRHCHHYWV